MFRNFPSSKLFLMAVKVVSRTRKQPGSKKAPSNKPESSLTKYLDFVITATRKSNEWIEVDVFDSPAGKLKKPITVKFSKKTEQQIHQSFVGSAHESGGQMMIQQKEAIDLGKRLSNVLLPVPVFSLFVGSLQVVNKNSCTGLRIRLSLDPDLMDLPWEYLYRPDSEEANPVSGFLMLDPSISIVREDVNPRIRITPINGKQQLLFIGTLWEDGKDWWEVNTEFTKLRSSLQPVSAYLNFIFKKASSKDAFDIKQKTGAAIFHYAGHCDTDDNGEPFLITEVPVSGNLFENQKVYTSEVAKSFRNSATRLVVLSACNSGFWDAVKPWLDAGIPAVVGVNGKVASISTNEFFPKLYESLAIGLTLDEAVSRARFHLMEWGLANGFFDWGLYMVYMPSSQAELFPRKDKKTKLHQEIVKKDHLKIVATTTKMVKEMDKNTYKAPINESINRQVLILGRFSPRRKKILDALKKILQQHPDGYLPLLLDGKKPENITLGEWGLYSAIASKFIIADISEPKSIPDELKGIIPQCPSRPVVPIINKTGSQYALSDEWVIRLNVAKPTIRYKNEEDLPEKVNDEVIPAVKKLFKKLALPKYKP